MYQRVVLALCLIGVLAASFVQETDYREQSRAFLGGERRNIRETHTQFQSQRVRKIAYYHRRRDGEHTGMHIIKIRSTLLNTSILINAHDLIEII